jgi:hypothetical protein
MVRGLDIIPVVRQPLKMGLPIIIAFPNTRQAYNTKRATAKNIGGSQIVNIRSSPPAVIKFEEMIASFMIAADKHSQIWCHTRATVVLVVITYLPVLLRNRHATQVI